jgi:hypothetical protein
LILYLIYIAFCSKIKNIYLKEFPGQKYKFSILYAFEVIDFETNTFVRRFDL